MSTADFASRIIGLFVFTVLGARLGFDNAETLQLPADASSVIFGLISLYKSIKLKAKLLTIAGLVMIFVGFLWLGPTVDFFLKVITNTNITPAVIYVFLSYTSVAPALFFAMYLGGELIMPKKKWILVGNNTQ